MEDLFPKKLKIYMWKLKNKEKYYCWCCDYQSITGEGRLAINYVKKLSVNNKLLIYTVNKITRNKILFKILNYKYISPFVGIIFCWYIFIRRKKTIYINYLPLWNFFLFIFLPPQTILGPITGGAYYIKNKQSYIRRYLFPFFYKISEFFLNFRSAHIIFSTDLLKPYLSKLTVKKSIFNYIFNLISIKKRKRKNIDFLIYYREHQNKKSFFPYDLIERLINLGFKIHIVGDYLKNSYVHNHGYINNKKINELLSRSFFSIMSNENPYTIFTIECLNNHVKIIADESYKKKVKYYKRQFLFLNFVNNINKEYLLKKKFIFKTLKV
jgi:hypothetical protein